MAEFNIRTDSVDVEQIMRQIRARIREKRGVDYTEQQIQELANVKLERFLDPKGVRSDLVEQFKHTRGTSPEPPNYSFEDSTLYDTHRGIVRIIRRLLHPILKLFFNPNPIVHVLNLQGKINNINAQQFRVREELDGLYYEVIHNLVLEVTRLGIETKNLKMRLESLNSRMDFDERRARALEGVVQYRPETGPTREPQPQVRSPSQGDRGRQYVQQPRQAPPPRPAPQPTAQDEPGPQQAPLGQQEPPPAPVPASADATGDGTARRRRRRRRGRRGGRGRNLGETAGGTIVGAASPDQAGTPPHGDPMADAALGAEGSDADYDDSESGDDEGPEPSEQ
jgi:hypothetical protein